ncbi:hypothetical protein Hokovirus_2_121 [Hokovirus HKV1]|uniref:Uncharacterized protein n=1 Tax=Hokovirus HKV1 TaxID=1977638 RepID=A0A1V0SG24_9VIRU|nr:hypothetical protein Hokovirus_2_121 [Hokovirus HKV1]
MTINDTDNLIANIKYYENELDLESNDSDNKILKNNKKQEQILDKQGLDQEDENDDIELVVSKKKRGRPKKNNMEIVQTKKKRGRKPKNDIKIPCIIKKTQNSEENPIILRLMVDVDKIDNDNSNQVSTTEDYKKKTVSDMKICAYSSDSEEITNCSTCSVYQQKILEKDSEINKLKHANLQLEKMLKSATKIDFMGSKETLCNLQFINNDTGEIMTKTDVCCFHDTCEFDGPPCFLPVAKVKDTYYVTKCFCSWNCAIAYNFSLNDNDVWLRHKLILSICSYKYGVDDVKAAPPRDVLTKFGGPIDIDTFRANFKMNLKDYKIVDPPMTILLSHVQEKYIPKK